MVEPVEGGANWVRKLSGTLTILRELPGERRAPFLRRDRLLTLRDARVGETARFAAETVPHYREMFRAIGTDPRSIRTAHDLERLPLIDKAIVQADPERFRSSSTAEGDAIPFRTTGSTAQPLTVYHDRRSLVANIAYGERERMVESRLVGRRRRYGILELRARDGTTSRVHTFYASSTYRPFRPRRQQLTVGTPPEDVLAAVERLRPAVINSYGGYLELLFRVAAATGRLRHRPQAVVYAGDTMSRGGRELIEEEFGIPVLSAYNAVEAFKIGFTCEERTGFHLHEDLCHVWLSTEDGRQAAPGEQGEVVMSNLVNRGTVLLNYRLGDLARLTEEPCACGRSTRRLVDLEGRVDEVLALGDGSYVYPTEVWELFRHRPEILRYQLVQHAVDRFELRLVTASSKDTERAVADVVARLRGVLRGAQVQATSVDELPAEPGGKFRHLIPLAAEPARERISHAG